MPRIRLPAIWFAAVLCLAPLLDADEAAADRDDYQVRIFLANADGSGMKPLVELPEYKAQDGPTFSPDGKWIAFDAWRPQLGERLNDARIILVNADGTNPRVLGDGAMPSFSPRANRIAYSRYNANHGVWVMSSAGPDKECVLLDQHGWGAEWSPDGTRIVYASNAGQQGANLIVCNLIEGTREPLFDAQTARYRSVFWNFAWSPDSRKIAFKGERGDGKLEVGIVDARGAKYGLVSRFEGDVRPSLAYRPDGQRLLFSFKKPGAGSLFQLYALDPNGNQPPELLPRQDAARNNIRVAFSPDGKTIAIASQNPAAKKGKKDR